MKKFFFLIQVLVCLFPLIPLLHLGYVFNYDWDNHLFMIRYHGEYFRHHHTFPKVFNLSNYVGLAQPLFYGTFFYPILGFFSSFLGAALTVRIFIFIALFGQFSCIRTLFSKSSHSMSFFIASLFTWSIYPLTNIYNRCALPEFFAVCFLTMGMCLWIELASFPDISKKRKNIIGCALLFSLSICTHPITGLYGSCIALVNGLVTLYFSTNRKGLIKAAAFCLLIIALISSPFIYASLAHRSHLFISQTTQTLYYFKYIDSWYTRLMPFPFDYRSMEKGNSLETPYLDAQICLPLLLILLFSIYKLRRLNLLSPRTYRVPFLLNLIFLVFFFYASIHPYIISWFFIPKTFFSLQFHYRLISYINLSILLALYFLNTIRYPKPVLVICLTLSFFGVLVKFPHAVSVMKPAPSISITTPPTAFSTKDFVDSFHFKKTSEKDMGISFATDTGSQFGQTGPVNLELEKQSIVNTNVFAFPWNKILVNGVALESELVFADSSDTLSLKLSKGKYVLNYLFVPSPLWAILNVISWTCFLTATLFFGLLIFL